MKTLGTSELIVNSDGSIFHLGLRPGQIARKVILVGDPGRVDMVGAFLSDIEFRIQNREFCSLTGRFGDERISVVSTGIGTDNIDIVVQELDALMNIDLDKRRCKEKPMQMQLIRIGTSGAIQPDIPIGSYVASTHSIGLDGLLYYYRNLTDIMDNEMMKAIYEGVPWPDHLPKPYVVVAPGNLLSRVKQGAIFGINISAHGFYGPQGRELRLDLSSPSLNDKVAEFSYDDQRITNYEMESSALYGLAGMLGHEALTICLIVANRTKKEFLDNYQSAMNGLIKYVLESVIVAQDDH